MTKHKHPPARACARCGVEITYGEDGYPIHVEGGKKAFEPYYPVTNCGYIEAAVGTGLLRKDSNHAPPGKCLGCEAQLLHILPRGHTATPSWLKANGYDGVHFDSDKEFPKGAVLCWACADKRGGFDPGEDGGKSD